MTNIETNAQLPVSAFDLFSKSVEVVKLNAANFIILNILPFLSMVGSRMAENRADEKLDRISDFGGTGFPGYAFVSLAAFGLIVFVSIIIISLIIQAMLYGLELKGAQGKTPDLTELWAIGKKYWLRLFGFLLVYGLLIIGGLILLIIPGLIVLRRYFLAPYIMIDKDLSISEAMAQSAKITKPYSGAIWGVIGVAILVSLPSVIPVIGPFIAFVLIVLYSVAPALRYEELKKLIP